MKKIIKNNVRFRFLSSKIYFIITTIILLAINSRAQDNVRRNLQKEVDIKILSWEKTKFDKPIRLGAGKRVIEYQEAVVLKVQVSRDQFDSLPPNIEPFLYIGPEEYRIFRIERYDDKKELTLTFHIRNWEKLKDGWPIVLTIDHGAPVWDPKKFDSRGILRINLKDIRNPE